MSTKEQLHKLMAAKEEVEAKIAHNGNILSANGDIGMHGELVDADGYPRNDIDVYQVRQARQQIICLQNDYKELMNQINRLLNQYHSEIRNSTADPVTNNTSLNTQQQQRTETTVTAQTQVELLPLVKVNLVSPNSPAEEAGLRIDDIILQFGTINSSNFNKDLNQIGNVVRHMQNQRINLKVKRDSQTLDLILIPKTWNGRGLLGCNIVLTD